MLLKIDGPIFENQKFLEKFSWPTVGAYFKKRHGGTMGGG
jgi:hypothetical protein